MRESIFRDRTFMVVTLLISLCGFLLRVWGLHDQPLSGDDVGVALSALNYLERGHTGPTMWNHPHLRDIVIYATLHLFGRGVWGVKAASLFFGTLSVPLLAVLARRLFADRRVALLAALFLAVDPFHIDYSRQGVQEIYMAFFALSGICLALRSLDGVKPWSLVLSGLCFGLGIASKWYVALPLLVTCAFLAYHLVARNSQGSRSERACTGLFLCSTLLVIPLLVYLITFVPWFGRGYGIQEWIFLQKGMLAESKVHMGYNKYELQIDHNAFLWFVKPVAYADAVFGGGAPILLLAISNPLVWLLTLPSMAYLAYRNLREKRREFSLVLALFGLTYLQFLVLNRPVWAHTAFSVLPFALMASAYCITELAYKVRFHKPLLSAYLFLVIVTSIPLYLLATGRGHDTKFLQPVVEMYRPLHERQ